MRQDAQGWTGMTLRDGMGREAGRRYRMGNTCTPMTDSCQCMIKPPQYCKVISLQLKLKKNISCQCTVKPPQYCKVISLQLKKIYWSGLPCSPPGDPPNSRIKPRSPSL